MKPFILGAALLACAFASVARSAELEEKYAFLPSTDLHVLRYDVRLSVPTLDRAVLEKEGVEASASVSIASLRDLPYVKLHIQASALRISRVTDEAGTELPFSVLRGLPGGYELSGSVLKVDLPFIFQIGHRIVLRFEYRLTFDARWNEGRGFVVREDHYGGRLFFSSSWPSYTRFWVPSNDHPSNAAAFSFELHVPQGAMALANGRGGAEGVDAQGLRVFRWRQDEPISLDTASFIVGDLAPAPWGAGPTEVCVQTSGAESGPVPCDGPHDQAVEYALFSGRALQPLVYFEREFRKGAQAIGYFSSVFGGFPQAKLFVVPAPLETSIESTSLINLLRPQDLVHEIIHQWWGDAVRIPHWGDLWISEGFTTYLTGIFDEYLTGRNTAECVPDHADALRRPADTYGATFLGAYYKGAAVLDDLRTRCAALLGGPLSTTASRRVFLKVVADVYRSFRGRSLSTEQLVEHLRERLEGVLRSEGYSGDPAVVREQLDAWAARWFPELR